VGLRESPRCSGKRSSSSNSFARTQKPGEPALTRAPPSFKDFVGEEGSALRAATYCQIFHSQVAARGGGESRLGNRNLRLFELENNFAGPQKPSKSASARDTTSREDFVGEGGSALRATSCCQRFTVKVAAFPGSRVWGSETFDFSSSYNFARTPRPDKLALARASPSREYFVVEGGSALRAAGCCPKLTREWRGPPRMAVLIGEPKPSRSNNFSGSQNASKSGSIEP
jgi:hypothetical protein